jgi:hypothetical protein
MMIKTKKVILPYVHPLPVRLKTISENEFLEVCIDDKKFYLSSIRGFHNLSLDEIDYKIKYFFSNYQTDSSDIDYSMKFFNTLKNHDNFLSSISGEALFHIESLLYGLHPKAVVHPVLCNKLYDAQKSNEENATSKCLKIKIRSDEASLKKTISLINEIHKINPSALFRLDGNRRFELIDLINFSTKLEEQLSSSAFLNIDYFEEPFKIFYDTYLFSKRSKIKIALDEAAALFLNSDLLETNSPMVIKPSFLGLSTVRNWLKAEIRQKRRVIISSSFEHPSIMPGLIFLADASNSSGSIEFHGLENYLA